jgi:hypothetical protein
MDSQELYSRPRGGTRSGFNLSCGVRMVPSRRFAPSQLSTSADRGLVSLGQRSESTSNRSGAQLSWGSRYYEEYVNCERLQIMALGKTALSLILFAVAPIGLLAQQVTTIHVRVLDGRTGKNLSGMNLAFVDYHTDPDARPHVDLNGRMIVKTSANGDSYIANPDAQGVLVFSGLGSGVWTPCTRQKFYDSDTRTYGSEHLYAVSTIVTSGLVAKNNCSRRTATATPGELVLFVRPATWWEKFIWGMKS